MCTVPYVCMYILYNLKTKCIALPIWLNWSTEKMSKNSHGGAGVEKKIRQAETEQCQAQGKLKSICSGNFCLICLFGMFGLVELV